MKSHRFSGPSADRITRATVMRVLVAGFTLVIVLLIAAGFWVLQQIRSIQTSIADLEQLQTETTRLIEALEDEQTALNALFYRMSEVPQSLDREAIVAELDQTNLQIFRLAAGFRGTVDESLWRELQDASSGFVSEAKRLLALDGEQTLLSRDLLGRHNQIVGIVTRISQSSHQNSLATQRQLQVLTQEFLRSTTILLGSCLLIALICAIFTVQVTGKLFRKMEWQTGELSRVSWHLMQAQEGIARRFSHELHDELGQSLTALKANISGLAAGAAANPERLGAIQDLIDGAIGNVRQLSQLLHPTILDDFGLDASLRWLTENFTKHTGLEVRYESDFTGRVAEETETHLFRIAQEALTNVARHAKATQVRVELRATAKAVALSIQDNGSGLPSMHANERGNGFGLVGMRARASAIGGELQFLLPTEGGLRVEVSAPLEKGETV